MRSPTSSGTLVTSCGSSRKRYSYGSGNSSADRNENASLPSAHMTPCIAASEPSASPSGCSWVVRTKRSPSRSASSTSSRDDVTPLRVVTSSASRSISSEIRMPRSDVSS